MAKKKARKEKSEAQKAMEAAAKEQEFFEPDEDGNLQPMAGSTAMTDGFSTTIDLSGAGVSFEEKTITPPGVEGGDAIETTSMRNSNWRTMFPRALRTLTQVTVNVSYSPKDITDMGDPSTGDINNNQLITVTFPDGATIAFWGYVKSFIPGQHQEGSQPEATITIQPTNQDNTQAEVAPAYTAPV